MIKKVLCGLSLMGSVCLYGQTVSNFENVIPVVDSAYNGSNQELGMVSGAGHFWNAYNPAWKSWSGFSFSSKTDTATAKWSNQYSSISGNGANSSISYSVAYSNAQITFTESTNGDSILGVSLNNSTYTYKTIRDGDAFTKKFGGKTGNDTDFYSVKLKGFLKGKTTGEVIFYLADYRFSNNSKDYIVKDWTWVDLKSLGRIDELKLSFESTDRGQWGINTPTYVCLDSLVYNNSTNKFRPVAKNDQFLSAVDAINNAYKVLANDKDPDEILNGSKMKLVRSFTQGTTTIESDGKIKLAPNSNAYGWDTCLYAVTDSDLLSDTAQFKLLINDKPEAKNDGFIILSPQSVTLDILKNDVDEVKDSLKISIRRQPGLGMVTVSNDNQLIFTAKDTVGSNGNDTIRYQIEDEFGLIDSAEVYLTFDLTFSIASVDSKSNFLLYPNPANAFVTVKLNDGLTAEYRLLDIGGRVVQFGEIEESKIISVAELPRGIYIFKLNDGEILTQQKIIIN